MQNEQFNFKMSKERIDLVNYKSSLGHKPTKQNGNEYWYLSPLHEEYTASFKVDRNKQIWYDHGTGQGGDLIDFIKAYYHVSFKEVLAKVKEYLHFHESISHIKTSDKNPFLASEVRNKHIQIMAGRPNEKHYLKQYI